MIDFKTATADRMPSSRFVGDLQSGYLELAEDGEEIVDHMATWEKVDRRSDLLARRAALRILAVARGGLTAEEAAAECRVAALDLIESQRLDSIEDEHLGRVAEVGGEVQQISRSKVISIVAWYGGGPKGAA